LQECDDTGRSRTASAGGVGPGGQPDAGLAPHFSELLLWLYGFATGEGDLRELCVRLAVALECGWVGLVRISADIDGVSEILGLGATQATELPDASGIVTALRSSSVVDGFLQGSPDCVSIVLPVDVTTGNRHDDCLRAVVALHRKVDCQYMLCLGGSMDTTSWTQLEQDIVRLLPYLRQAAALREVAEQYRIMARADAAIFNRAPNALMMLMPDGTVAYLNDAARRLLAAADGMRLAGSRVVVHDVMVDEAIQDVLEGLRHGKEGRLPVGHDLLATRPSGARPYVVSLLPVIVTGGEALLLPRRWLLAIVTDLSTRRIPGGAYLQQVYGLSQAEARVCLKVGDGDSLEDMAAELNVSVATVKSHLLRIYRKLDVDSRVQLAQVLQGHVWTSKPIIVDLGAKASRSQGLVRG